MTTWFNSIAGGIGTYFYFIPVAIAIVLIYSFLTNKFELLKFLADNLFVLYIFCLFAVVFFPLPSAEAASKLSGYHGQWIPGRFLFDIAKDRSLESVLQVLFNLVMLAPFGAYLRLCHHTGTVKVILLSFALSLFIEVGQLTGLFFTYSGSYRLFDVDDLIFNTLGGVAGAAVTSSVCAYLPSLCSFDVKNVFANLIASVIFSVRKTHRHA